jgi:hypothetical protein
MEKHFVTFEQALALKELGFDEPCLSVFYSSLVDTDEDTIKFILEYTESQYYAQKGYVNGILRPLKSQVFEWARKEHVLYHIVHHFEHNKNTANEFLSEVTGKLLMGNDDISGFSYHSTYNDGELACIDILIEIVKSNKQ